MARATLTKITPLGSYPALALVADSADITFTAANATDKEQFVMSGNDLLLAWNTGAGARTVTLTSSADPNNRRTGDITTYSIGAGEIAVFGPFKKDGWVQSGNYMFIEAAHAEVKWAVITLP